MFGNRLIFDENDIRLEYRGDIKDGRIMHGQGTLMLRDDKTTFKGVWADNVSKEWHEEMKHTILIGISSVHIQCSIHRGIAPPSVDETL